MLERLNGVSDSRLAGVLGKLVALHDALKPLRTKAETLIHQPKATRDTKVADGFRKTAQDDLDAILALTVELENALKLTDPVVDHLLGVKQSAWAARNFGGFIAIRLEAAAAAAKPWTAADIVGAAEDAGRAKQAWSQVQDATSRADAPASLTDVMARSKQGDALAMIERQQGLIKALSNNQTIDTKGVELAKLNTAILNFYVEAGQVALAEMVSRAGRQMTTATWSLALNGGMMLVALAITLFGFILVSRRVSAPIRKLTQAMRSLAKRDYAIELAGIARGDEIGETSRAVSVFRENMIAGDRLTEEQARKQGRKEQRQLAVDRLIEQFEKTVTESLHTLASASGELNATAQSMSSTAERGSSKAASVASLSGDASSNVQTVAAATEELSASISEISRQVAESSSIAGAAASEADRTNAEVQALADAAQRASTRSLQPSRPPSRSRAPQRARLRATCSRPRKAPTKSRGTFRACRRPRDRRVPPSARCWIPPRCWRACRTISSATSTASSETSGRRKSFRITASSRPRSSPLSSTPENWCWRMAPPGRSRRRRRAGPECL